MMAFVGVLVLVWIVALVCSFCYDMVSEVRHMKEIKQAQVERDYLETVAMIGGHVNE